MDLRSHETHEELSAKLLAKAEQEPEFRHKLMLNPALVLEQELGSSEAADKFLKDLNRVSGPDSEVELAEAELDEVTGGSFLTTIKVWLMGNKSKFVNDGSGGVAGTRG